MINLNFDGLIFDLDGTLWDCSEPTANAFNQVFREFNQDTKISGDFIKSISGKPSTECDEILLQNIPKAIVPELSRRMDQAEIQALQLHGAEALYPDVIEGLSMLSKKYQLFLVSNCGTGYLEAFLSHTPIGKMFVDSECFGNTHQPKYSNIKLLAARNNLSAPCYIGDTAGDESSAAKANLPFFHAGYGFGQTENVHISFKNFQELTTHFMSLP